MLNQTAEYALRTAVLLAERQRAGSVPAIELAAALHIPANYLSKILHQLAKVGVLSSQRGRTGGFQLARDAGKISLAEVVRPFDEVGARRSCLLGRPACSDRSPCEAHGMWKDVSARVSSFFHETTLAAMVDASGPRRRRLRSRRAARATSQRATTR